MLPRLRERVANRWWIHTAGHLYGETPDPSSLRLVLGVGRSGTSWLAAVLSRTRTPLRYLKEPLFHLTPPLRFARHLDHTAIQHARNLEDDHRLVRAYSLLASRNWPADLLAAPDCKQRDDLAWKLCLVKEVHSLLATEGLLRRIRCPTLMLVRTPVQIVDSLLAAQGTDTIYLGNEFRHVQEDGFLEWLELADTRSVNEGFRAVAGAPSARLRAIGEKLLAAALVQCSLVRTARDLSYVRRLDYETLCQSPAQVMRCAADFLSLDWSEEMDEFLHRTSASAGAQGDADPYSTFRDTARQMNRPLRFLSSEEATWCEELLTAAGLQSEQRAIDPA